MQTDEYKSDITGNSYSSSNFIRLIEQRIRKDIRNNKLINEKSQYTIFEDDSMSSKVLKTILDKIYSSRLDIEFTKEKTANTLSSETMEEFSKSRLDIILTNAEPNNLHRYIITPLRTVSNQELLILAQLFKIKGSFPQEEHEFVTGMQTKQSQTKTSVARSFVFLQNSTEKSPDN